MLGQKLGQEARAVDVDPLDLMIERASKAQSEYANYSQEDVDHIFEQVAKVASKNAIPLARETVDETGMGWFEDKVIKNKFAAENIYNKYKNAKTCGVISSDESHGFEKIAAPIGNIACVIPTTNPTSTTVFKVLLCLKTRNSVILSPHPRARKATLHTARLLAEAAEKAGAPTNLINCIENPTVDQCQALMKHRDIDLILATGGGGMVRSAYSSGNPAIGVGSGNTPAVIDRYACVRTAVSSILHSKTFDHGLICASEQAVIVEKSCAQEVRDEFEKRGARFLSRLEKSKLKKVLKIDGALNRDIIGQPAHKIAELAGIDAQESTKVLVVEANPAKIGPQDPFSGEKLSPVLAIYQADEFEHACKIAERLIAHGGMGHTAVLHTGRSRTDRITRFSKSAKVGRLLVNQPAAHGAIGSLYNTELAPSLTLGCGSWGGNSVSENIGVKHLLNVQSVAKRVESMMTFRVPPKTFSKKGCLSEALANLEGNKRAFIITDCPSVNQSLIVKIGDILRKQNVTFEVYSSVEEAAYMGTAKEILGQMDRFQPDTVIAAGSELAMDLAKICRAAYEGRDLISPEIAAGLQEYQGADSQSQSQSQSQYQSRRPPRALLVTIPTDSPLGSATGSEVTPLATLQNEENGQNYCVESPDFTPDVTIVDPELSNSLRGQSAAYAGLDTMSRAAEALVSTEATDYTDALAYQALEMLFEYLPKFVGETGDEIAKEKILNASTIAGMAFANTKLGVCHSLAQQLATEFRLPLGMCSGIVLPHAVKYNAVNAPSKQATGAQCFYPVAKEKYAKIADHMGLGGGCLDEKVKSLTNAARKMLEELGCPQSLQEAGVDRSDFMNRVDQLADQAFADQCNGSRNPRFPLLKELRQLLIHSYGEIPDKPKQEPSSAWEDRDTEPTLLTTWQNRKSRFPSAEISWYPGWREPELSTRRRQTLFS